MDDLGAVQVFFRFRAGAQLMPAKGGEASVYGVKESFAVVMPAVRFHFGKSHAAQGTGRVGEPRFHELGVQTHGFEQLGALVGLQGGDAHLGGDLQHARREGPVVFGYGCIGVFRMLPAHDFVSQIRVHRPGAERDQHRQLVGVPWLATLQYHGDRRALFNRDKMLLQRGDCQKRWDGYMPGIHAPV